ncbi:uncharacterized protein RHOBADRAFT_66778, partial [Rhodotorula graminis WP1]
GSPRRTPGRPCTSPNSPAHGWSSAHRAPSPAPPIVAPTPPRRRPPVLRLDVRARRSPDGSTTHRATAPTTITDQAQRRAELDRPAALYPRLAAHVADRRDGAARVRRARAWLLRVDLDARDAGRCGVCRAAHQGRRHGGARWVGEAAVRLVVRVGPRDVHEARVAPLGRVLGALHLAALLRRVVVPAAGPRRRQRWQRDLSGARRSVCSI